MHFPNEVPAVVHHTDAKRKEQFKKASPDGADLSVHTGLKLKAVKVAAKHAKVPKKVTSF